LLPPLALQEKNIGVGDQDNKINMPQEQTELTENK